ncbi:MAG: DNA mismatch repair protein MutS [Endomicrobiia bacterium]|nr:DNA mismatch repair protein MutS [Endomicrobiia bacterium]
MAKKNIGKIKSDANARDITPLMSQYEGIKSAHPGYIVFFRLGDFYEMFGEDAVVAAPILGVVLTKRQQTPMCGVPHHSSANYIKTLLAAGKKIALCEQVESADGSGKLMNREVVRLITPGTVWEENLLDARRSNYVMAIFFGADGRTAGVAAADISASDSYMAEVPADEIAYELASASPGEIIVPESSMPSLPPFIRDCALITVEPDWFFDEARAMSKMKETAGIATWNSIDPGSHHHARAAMGGLLSYLERIRFCDPAKVVSCAVFRDSADVLRLAPSAIKTLEIVENMRDGSVEGALLDALDETKTPPGARLIKKILLEPLTDVEDIARRHDAVAFLAEDSFTRRRLREELAGIGDVERIVTRLSAASASPREIYHLSVSIKKAASLKTAVAESSTAGLGAPSLITETLSLISSLDDVTALVDSALEPSDRESGFIKRGFDAALDELLKLSTDARAYILELERREKTLSGINSLKIGYNSVNGYYIEITKTHSASAPPGYERKQTLANAERFVIPELVEVERNIIHAAERADARRKQIMDGVRDKILSRKKEILSLAGAVAVMDTLCSFAETAATLSWVRPTVNSLDAIAISDLRHPVVERRLRSGKFVPNDVNLGGDRDQIILLTGPNMAGKSTYLRQTALAVILAQAGSFVPASKAVIGVVDKIFTRIGSSDNLASGESTFMVEMTETASIIRGMTPRSLVILDEVGRGTSTFDGISIAWAIVEYLHARGHRADGTSLGGPKVLFATHYFELTELAEKLPRVKNLSVSVSEWKNEVVFLYKIVPGAADRSYGIHVAKLAGMPQEIIESSRRILLELETNSHGLLKKRPPSQESSAQMDFEDFLIFDKLRNINVDKITPVEALNILADMSRTSADAAEKRRK